MTLWWYNYTIYSVLHLAVPLSTIIWETVSQAQIYCILLTAILSLTFEAAIRENLVAYNFSIIDNKEAFWICLFGIFVKSTISFLVLFKYINSSLILCFLHLYSLPHLIFSSSRCITSSVLPFMYLCISLGGKILNVRILYQIKKWTIISI